MRSSVTILKTDLTIVERRNGLTIVESRNEHTKFLVALIAFTGAIIFTAVHAIGDKTDDPIATSCAIVKGVDPVVRSLEIIQAIEKILVDLGLIIP